MAYPPWQRALKSRPCTKPDRPAPTQLLVQFLGILGRAANLRRVDARGDKDSHIKWARWKLSVIVQEGKRVGEFVRQKAGESSGELQEPGANATNTAHKVQAGAAKARGALGLRTLCAVFSQQPSVNLKIESEGSRDIYTISDLRDHTPLTLSKVIHTSTLLGAGTLLLGANTLVRYNFLLSFEVT